jgi:hypothetical protein
MPDARQHRDTSETEGVSPALQDVAGQETLKSLARRVLNTTVSGVPRTGNETASHVFHIAEAPEGQQKDTVKRSDCLRRLEAAGVSIAIDKQTGAALIIFAESDAQSVRHVATVYKPFEVPLTKTQLLEVIADLDYYEGILQKKTVHRGKVAPLGGM